MTAWSEEAARAIIRRLERLDGALLPILHALQDEFGYVDPAAVPLIAMAYDSSGPRAVLLVAVVFACGVVAGAVLFMLASARPNPHPAVAPAE